MSTLPLPSSGRIVLLALMLLLAACGSATSTGALDTDAETTTPTVAETAAPEPATTASTTATTAAPETTTTASTTTTTAAPESTTTASTTTASTTTTTAAPETTTTVAPEATAAPATTATPQTTAAPATTVAPETTAATTTAAPNLNGEVFSASIFEIGPVIAARMELSWREGCPVPLSDLRLITLNYWNYNGAVASGELVVNAAHAEDVVGIFSKLFEAQFPIERMELVDNFNADDDLSMVANNTSGFNCRNIAGTENWSNHAFGSAIDINPLVNPWVTNSGVFPPEGAEFADRTSRVQGGIYAGDVVTQAFAAAGWRWGGDWNSSKDWQHFDKR